MDFFNEQDLKTLRYWANREYNKTNTDHLEAKKELTEGVWAKTKKWCDDVAKETSLEPEAKLTWLKQAGPGKFVFRPYSWGKILNDQLWTDEVYFTVGVNSDDDQHLRIQLNYRNEAPKQTCHAGR